MSYLTIIGVGRGGIHTVNEMFRNGQGDKDVSFMVCDTDEVILLKSPVENKFLMALNPGSEQFLTENTRQDFIQKTGGYGIVIFIAGMGGRSGRDLLPELISCCHALEIKTCCLVTSPFAFEGEVKIKIAEDTLFILRQCADSIVVVPNDIIQKADADLILANAFQKLHLIVAELCHELCFILTEPSYVSLELKDILNILRNSATNIIVTGYSKGENRIITSFENAIKSPFFQSYKIGEVDRIICSFQCSEQHQITMNEVEFIHEIMRTKIKEGVDFIWLAYFNSELNEEVKVTLFISIDK